MVIFSMVAAETSISGSAANDTLAELERGAKELQKEYNRMIEDFEHEFASLKEQTWNTIEKLRKSEEEDTRRIESLEQWVNGKVNEKLNEKLPQLQASVDNALDSKLKEAEVHTSGWKTPFFILLLAIVLAAGFGYKKYQELRKSHLL
jgi:mannose-binding lectin 2